MKFTRWTVQCSPFSQLWNWSFSLAPHDMLLLLLQGTDSRVPLVNPVHTAGVVSCSQFWPRRDHPHCRLVLLVMTPVNKQTKLAACMYTTSCTYLVVMSYVTYNYYHTHTGFVSRGTSSPEMSTVVEYDPLYVANADSFHAILGSSNSRSYIVTIWFSDRPTTQKTITHSLVILSGIVACISWFVCKHIFSVYTNPCFADEQLYLAKVLYVWNLLHVLCSLTKPSCGLCGHLNQHRSANTFMYWFLIITTILFWYYINHMQQNNNCMSFSNIYVSLSRCTFFTTPVMLTGLAIGVSTLSSVTCLTGAYNISFVYTASAGISGISYGNDMIEY